MNKKKTEIEIKKEKKYECKFNFIWK